MSDIRTFTDSEEAYKTANRMAVHGHHDWLVWKLPDGTYKVSRISIESLTMALAECAKSEKGKNIITMVARNVGHYYYVGPNIAAVWLANMEAGHYDY
jgi:hypothetical protein